MKNRFFRSSIASLMIYSIIAVKPAWAVNYRESEDYSRYIQGLVIQNNGDLFSSFMDQLMGVAGNCAVAAGVTAGAAVIDTVPLIGLARHTVRISKGAGKFLKSVGVSLKLEDLPYLSRSLQALAPVANRLATMTPDAIRNLMVAAVPAAAVHSAYAERVFGAVLGFHAESPQDLAEAVETLGPHILGGGLSALLDLGLFKAMSSALNIDRSPMPEGQMVREAYRATLIAAGEGFSENSACRVSKANLEAAMDEMLMRNRMIKRPGQMPATTDAQNLNPITNDRRIGKPDSARPFGGSDNGGPPFKASSSSSAQ